MREFIITPGITINKHGIMEPKTISTSIGIAINKHGIMEQCNNPKICKNCGGLNVRRNRLCFNCKQKLK